jgi:hypothetical protein
VKGTATDEEEKEALGVTHYGVSSDSHSFTSIIKRLTETIGAMEYSTVRG